MDVDQAKRMLKLRFDKDLAEWLGLKDPKSIANYRKDGALPVGHAARVELAEIKARNGGQAETGAGEVAQ